MLGEDHGPDPAADQEITFDAHPLGLRGGHEIIQDLVGHGFVKGAAVPVAPEVELQGFRFDADLVWLVADGDMREVRLAGHGAEAGEFLGAEDHFEGPPRPRALKSVEVHGGLGDATLRQFFHRWFDRIFFCGHGELLNLDCRLEGMWTLLPLGNPGAEYANTRHNMGRLMLQRWMADRGLKPPVKKKFAHGTLYGLNDHLQALVPATYMNLSGEVLPEADAAGIYVRKLVMLHDDKDLPLGYGRFRLEGGDGGHNGLKSIFHHAGTQAIARLRLYTATGSLDCQRTSRTQST